MFAITIRVPMLVLAGIAVVVTVGTAVAADRASFLTSCEKDADKTKCACVADKVDGAFKDKALAFAYLSLAQPIGELVQSDSGLTEKEEDDIVDQIFVYMKECGLVK